MTYITKTQRIAITNFLKWLMVFLDLDLLNKSIFEDYISGIDSTMLDGINQEILDSLPIETKVDLVNRLLISLGKIQDFALLIKLSQYLEEYNLGNWIESVMIRSIITIAQHFFTDSIRIVPLSLNKASYKLNIYLNNLPFEIRGISSSFTNHKYIIIEIGEDILRKTMEYDKQPSHYEIEELLGNLLTITYSPIELHRCEYINLSYKNLSYLKIQLTDQLHKNH